MAVSMVRCFVVIAALFVAAEAGAHVNATTTVAAAGNATTAAAAATTKAGAVASGSPRSFGTMGAWMRSVLFLLVVLFITADAGAHVNATTTVAAAGNATTA